MYKLTHIINKLLGINIKLIFEEFFDNELIYLIKYLIKYFNFNNNNNNNNNPKYKYKEILI